MIAHTSNPSPNPKPAQMPYTWGLRVCTGRSGVGSKVKKMRVGSLSASLLLFKNEGDSGDMYENKGAEKTEV